MAPAPGTAASRYGASSRRRGRHRLPRLWAALSGAAAALAATGAARVPGRGALLPGGRASPPGGVTRRVLLGTAALASSASGTRPSSAISCESAASCTERLVKDEDDEIQRAESQVAEGVKLEKESELLKKEAAQVVGRDDLELDKTVEEKERRLQDRVRAQEEVFSVEEKRLEEARIKMVAAQERLMAEEAKLVQEQRKVRSERLKLAREDRELDESEEMLRLDEQRLIRRDRAFRFEGVAATLQALREEFVAKK